MGYVLSTVNFPKSEANYDLYFKGKWNNNGTSLIFIKGEVYSNQETSQIQEMIDKDGVNYVKGLKGSFSIIYYNIACKEIIIVNDKMGRENTFYFNSGEQFIISDDFWEIVNIIEPSEMDIEIESLKEAFLFFVPFSYRTIIKNLSYLPPASILNIDLKKKKHRIEQYWDFEYKPDDSLSLEDAANKLDELFDNAMKRVYERFDKNTRYGLGLSGGLDSRLIPKYTKKYGMILEPFIVNEIRPHGLFVSHDINIARKLAKFFNISLKEIAFDSESFEKKIFDDIRFNPIGGSNFFLANRSKMNDFDVLLAGTNGGETLGATIPININDQNDHILCETLIDHFSYMNVPKKRGLIGRTINAFKTILGKTLNKNDWKEKRNSIDGVINPTEFNKIKNKIISFIEDNKGKNKISIYQKYLFMHLISRNKYGFFDSQYGSKVTFGIYTDPYVFEESLKWKEEFLLNKSLQKYYFLNKARELAKFPTQDANVPLIETKKSIVVRTIYLLRFILRGKGLRYSDWAQKTKYRKFSFEILDKENILFKKYFEIEKIKDLSRHDMRMYEDIVKYKRVLDIILSKEYKNYF